MAASDPARRLAGLGGRAVVTGATGWLGRIALERLTEAGVPCHGYASRAAGDIRALEDLGAPPAGDGPLVLLHFAFLSRARLARLGHDAYVAANAAIASRVLDWVAAERPAAVLLASSGAAAAGLPLSPDPYGAMKRLDELAFAEASRRVGARLRTVRVYNVTGRHMTTPEEYALGALILAALRGEPLRIRARGPVLRSYLAIDDLVDLAIAELIADDGPEQLTFDTAGATVEIGELADAIRATLGASSPIERDLDPDAPQSAYLGDPAKMSELLARHGLTPTPLDEQIRQTAEGLR